MLEVLDRLNVMQHSYSLFNVYRHSCGSDASNSAYWEAGWWVGGF